MNHLQDLISGSAEQMNQISRPSSVLKILFLTVNAAKFLISSLLLSDTFLKYVKIVSDVVLSGRRTIAERIVCVLFRKT